MSNTLKKIELRKRQLTTGTCTMSLWFLYCLNGIQSLPKNSEHSEPQALFIITLAWLTNTELEQEDTLRNLFG